MKTWEMIKALTENPKLSFINSRNTRISIDNDGYVLIFGIKDRINENLDINAEWELIQEPVDFTTAIKAFKEGKKIYVIYGVDFKHTYINKIGELYDERNDSITYEEILNGKWYIEE
jgi:hypothetical protein